MTEDNDDHVFVPIVAKWVASGADGDDVAKETFSCVSGYIHATF